MRLPFCAVCMKMDQDELHTYDLSPNRTDVPQDDRTITLCTDHSHMLLDLWADQHHTPAPVMVSSDAPVRDRQRTVRQPLKLTTSAALRPRGVQKPTQPAQASPEPSMHAQRGAKVSQAADVFARRVLTAMRSAVVNGCTTYGAVARYLNDHDVASRRNTKWTATTVQNVDARLGHALF